MTLVMRHPSDYSFLVVMENVMSDTSMLVYKSEDWGKLMALNICCFVIIFGCCCSLCFLVKLAGKVRSFNDINCLNVTWVIKDVLLSTIVD